MAESLTAVGPMRLRADLPLHFDWVTLCLVIVVERKWKFVNEITDRHAQNHFLQLTVSLKPSGARNMFIWQYRRILQCHRVDL